MSFELATTLIGGIGLFLLGMRLMTEGLRVAAGEALRGILARSTRTRLRGVVALGSGAALVIGANVGTTSTAGLAVIGATPNAKRVAAGHVAFNVITGAVALALLPPLLFLILRGREMLHLDAEPAAVLAGFHTLFNLLGVALMWPLTSRLLRFLEGRFRTAEEDEATPRTLDRNVLATPDLALDAMALELTRVGQISRRLAIAALGSDRHAQSLIPAGRSSLANLVEAVGEFTQLLQRKTLPPAFDALLPTILRVSRYYSEAAELAAVIAEGSAARSSLESRPLGEEIRAFVVDVRVLVERAGLEEEQYRVAEISEQATRIAQRYQQLKTALLDAGSKGLVPVHDLVSTLDWLSNVRRVSEQVERGTRHLASLTTRRELVTAVGEEGAGMAG